MNRMIGKTCPNGPGGRNCPCCGQAPGKARKAARRAAKRAERREYGRQVAAAIAENPHAGWQRIDV